jgi:alcohol dehydrogenase (cytochrome c)
MVIRSTSDGYLIALEAETGKELWQRLVTNAAKNELMTMAPLIYDDLVIAGIGISELGVKGWIGGFRRADGEPVWRFNTIPEEGEPGAETWTGAEDKPRGGGGIWVTPSLDTAKGLLYVAVGNPVPDFFGNVRMGDNLYTATMIVLDAKTGKLQWFRQFVPHDLHDWDLTVTNPLYSAVIDGTSRSLVSVAGKDGILRAVDRESRSRRCPTPTPNRHSKAFTRVRVFSAGLSGILPPITRRRMCLSLRRWIGAACSRRRTSCVTYRGSFIWVDRSHSILSRNPAVG